MNAPHDLDGLGGLLRQFWPRATSRHIDFELLSQRRHATHWRLRFGDETCVLRATDRGPNAERIVAALAALEGEFYAPRLYGSQRDDRGGYLIAMEDVAGSAPQVEDVQSNLDEFTRVLRHLHAHTAFHRVVDEAGRTLGEDTSRHWIEEEWTRLLALAPTDPRVRRAERWLDTLRRPEVPADLLNSIVVHGHGDLHRENWRLGPSGPVLLDWEEIRAWPLASELADFIVFSALDPVQACGSYGASQDYAVAVRLEAAACALSFYLYWLRTLIEKIDPREDGFVHAERMCVQLFHT